MNIFIAGPRRGNGSKDEIKNIAIANKHAKKLANEGHLVYVPHNNKKYISNKKEQYKYAINLSKSLMDNWATHIYMLPGWKKSGGSVEEYNYAKKIKLKILKE